MTTGRPRSPGEVRVALSGSGDHVESVRSTLSAIEWVTLGSTTDSEADHAADAAVETVVVHCPCLDESAEAAAGTNSLSATRSPSLVALPETVESMAVEEAYDLQPTAVVVGAGDTLVERLAWLTENCRGDDSPHPTTETVEAGLGTFGDPTCVVDRRFVVRTATPTFADFLETTVEDCRGASLWSVFPPLRAVADECWAAIETGERTTFETVHDERRVQLMAAPLADGLALRLQDVTERRMTEERADRYSRILETIDDGVYTLDENFRIAEVNDAVTELTGYDRDELVGSHATMLADERVIAEAATVIQEILTGERSDGRLDVELETAGGDRLPVETRFSALRFGDGSHGSVGVIRDIGDRKRYELTLTALNSSAHDLFHAQTTDAVGDTVVETATRVLELTSAVLYIYDDETGTLVPHATAGEGDPALITPGDGALWESFVEGRSTQVGLDSSLEAWDQLQAVDSGALTSDSHADVPDGAGGLAVPLGDHGLFATMTDEAPPKGQETLTRLLAANTEAALDRVERSVELERRKEELAARNAELTRLNRFTELFRDVNRILVEADSRAEIERAVCNRLANSPAIAFAWIGSYDRSTGGLTPRTWGGSERGYLDFLNDPDADVADEPSVVAAETAEPTVVENVAVDVQRHPWRRQALDRGLAAVVSIPLTYDQFSFGVLSVYATDRDAFDRGTRRMFEELGDTTANAMNSVAAKESLHTDTVVELDLRVHSPNALLYRVAQAVGGTVDLVGSVPKGESGGLHYLTFAGDADIDALRGLTAVEVVRPIVDREEGTLYELETTEQTLPSRVANLGGAVRSLVAGIDGVEAVVELAPGMAVRGFVEALRETYPDTQLTAKHHRERAVETRQGVLSDLESHLTDRQFEVLRSAYFSGYFAWPRERTGQEVAASLDVAQPTFARHLRVAERKLLSRLLEGE